MTAHLFKTGLSGNVLVGSHILSIVEWNFKEDGSEVDTTSTTDGLYGSFIVGPHKVTVSVKAYYDFNNDPYTSPISLSVGDTVTLTLELGDSGSNYVVPALVHMMNVVNNVKNPISFDFDATYYPSNGSITYPS